MVELATLEHDSLAHPAQISIPRFPALLRRGLYGLAGRVGRCQCALCPDPGVGRHHAVRGDLEPVRDQVGVAVWAAADPALLVAVVAAVLARETAHHPDELELSVEFPHQPPERRLGSPRPGAGGIGIEADLDSHHSFGCKLAAAGPP